MNLSILQTCWFGQFRHAWLWTLNKMVSAGRNLWCLSSSTKIKFLPHLFLKILLRYCELVILSTFVMPGYTHVMPGYTHQKSNSINLQETLKINLTPHLCHEILQFKVPYNLIGHFGILAHNLKIWISPDNLGPISS